MLKWLQHWPCFWFRHISSIVLGSPDHFERGTREWILILRMRHLILHNTKRPFWSMWRMNTVWNIRVCRSISMELYRAAILSPLQQLQDPVNHPLILMICPAMMKNTLLLTLWLRRHPDNAVAQHVNWPPPGTIWILRLMHQRTRGKSIQISMITTPNQRRLAVHSGSRT